MHKVVLVTGAATGIGNLIARTLAAAGHKVYASMLDSKGKNVKHATELADFARTRNLTLPVIDLDVTSQHSAHDAVKIVLDEAGQIDTVVHNAGHLAVGYAEASLQKISTLCSTSTSSASSASIEPSCLTCVHVAAAL